MQVPSSEIQTTDVSVQTEGEEKSAPAFSVKILRNAIGNYGGTFVTMAIGILLTPFIVHHLGDTAYGVWGLTGSIIAYFQLLDFGLSAAVVKYVAQYEAQDRQTRINEVASTLFFAYCALALLALGAIVGLSYYFVSIFRIPAEYAEIGRIVFLLAGINFVITLPTSILNGLLVGYQRIDLNNLVGILSRIANAVLTVLLFRLGFGLVALALISIATTLMLAAGRLYMIRRTAPRLRIRLAYFDRRSISQVTTFSLLVFGLNITGLIALNTDNLVIGFFLSATAVTPFVIAYKLANFLPQLVNPFAAVLFPAFAELHGKQDAAAIQRMLVRGTKLSTGLSLAFSLTFLILGEYILTLWMGAEYLASVPVMKVLVVSNLLQLMGRPAMNLLLGTGKVKGYLLIAVVNAALNLFLSIVLVQRYGIMGVALGTALPMLFLGGLTVLAYAARVVHLSVLRTFRSAILPPILAAVPAAVATVVLRYLWPPVNLPLLAFESLVCLVIYAATYLLAVTSSVERRGYARVLKGLVFRPEFTSNS